MFARSNGIFFSLRSRISFILGVSALALALLISVIAGQISRDQIMHDSGQMLLQLAQQFTRQLDRDLFERWREVRIMATLENIRNPYVPAVAKRQLFEEMQSSYPYYSWIGWVDANGTVQASTGGLLEGVDVSERPWFVRGKQAPFVGDVHEAVLLASLLPPPEGNAPLRFLDIAVPITNRDADVLGVLGTHITWEWASDLMEGTLSLTDPSISLTILNQDGNILLHSQGIDPGSATLSSTVVRGGIRGHVTETWSDGTVYLTGYAHDIGYDSYPGLGWVILARQPLDVALQPVYLLQAQIVLFGLVCGAGFALGGWLVTRHITTPLKIIAGIASRIRQGDTDIAIPAFNGRDEVSLLAQTLNDLVVTLNQRNRSLETLNATLETQVAERTRAAEQRAEELSSEIVIRREIEAALVESQDSFRRVTESAFEGIAVSIDGEIQYANAALLNMFGYTGEEMRGISEGQIIAPELREAYFTSLESTLFETQGMYIDGWKFPIEVFKRPMIYLGSIARVIFIRDVSQRKAAEEEMNRLYRVTTEQLAELQAVHNQLSYQAVHDHLTGLANRHEFENQLQQALASPEDAAISVFYIDMDRFKLVNDTLGHAAGDELLRQIADRLRTCIPEGATLARLGGDEYALILPSVSETDQALAVARQMIDELRRPFLLHENSVVVTSSIGISFYPSDAQSATELLQKADSALYRAKESGRNNYFLAQNLVPEEMERRVRLERDLRAALVNGEFFLVYQPQYDLKLRQIIGVEALVRWQHPELGLVQPVEFISVAEESGLIIPLGQWVLEEACRAAATWQAQGLGMVVAVNISALQTEQPQFVEAVIETLERQGVPPGTIELEITESMLMHQNNIDHLQALCQLGVNFAIDDFGTGYSSLSSLQRLPITTVKIDRSFILEISEGKPDVIIRAMITMAHSLNMRTVAEGVETPEQLAVLAALECDLIQGYLISKPLPEADLVSFMQVFSGIPALGS